MKLVNFDLKQMVSVKDDEVITTSLKVAEYFGKKHSGVMRVIRELKCSKEFSQCNFASAKYIDAQGKARSMYHITRDGCMFLIMGFTGDKASVIKEAYIKAFNAMAKKIEQDKKVYMEKCNALMLEWKSEKQLASNAGRSLNRWGRQVKPYLSKEIVKLSDKVQLKLFQ